MFFTLEIRSVFLFIFVFSQNTINYARGESSKTDRTTEDTKLLGGHRPLTSSGFSKYVVSVRYGQERTIFGDNHICSGTIIKPHVVLTSAYCVTYSGTRNKKQASDLTVVAGSDFRLEKTDDSQIMRVRKVISFEKYRPQTMENDIALLILKGEILLDNKTTGILPISSEPVFGGTECTVVGWGRLFFKGPFPDQIMHVNVTVQDRRLCIYQMQAAKKGIICAGNKEDVERATCWGDSGGPMICNRTVAGVVSYGVGCGIKGVSGYYSDVYHYQKWITASKAMSLQIHVVLFQIHIMLFYA